VAWRVRLKPLLLVELIDKYKMEQCMIFCRTNLDCDLLEDFLVKLGGGRRFGGMKMEKGKENPYSCCVLAGMRSMQERRTNLQAFKDGDVRFLICTDVAARGGYDRQPC
jgi:ATP-dependent RNA helicase DDX1